MGHVSRRSTLQMCGRRIAIAHDHDVRSSDRDARCTALPTRIFVAFSSRRLAISASVCFHDVFNASAEEVHMKIHWTNHHKPMLCATAAAAADPALLG
jgi:hypothetical protein